MKTLLAPRASAILFDLLRGQRDGRTFILPANICPIVPITFFKAGVPFEFVDIEAQTLGIDLDEVRKRLAHPGIRWGGVLYAHTYGDPATPQDFFREIKERWPELLVIDDRCLCVPDLSEDEATAADVVLYSTGYGKIVDTPPAGFAFIRSEAIPERQHLAFDAAALEVLEAEYKACVAEGRPYSYQDSNWLQTEAELPSWPDYTARVQKETTASLARRRSINDLYASLIPSEIQLPERFQLWRFSVRLANKARALQPLFEAGLFASAHYASLVGIMGIGTGDRARDLAEHVVNLFNDHHYTLDMAEQTAEIIRRSA